MPFTPSRRAAAAMLGGLALSPLLPRLSIADRYLDVHGGGSFTPVNVAIVPFAGDSGASIASVIVNNFKRSVFIDPLDAGAAGRASAPTPPPTWRPSRRSTRNMSWSAAPGAAPTTA